MKILENNARRGKPFKGSLKVRCPYCEKENGDLEVGLVIDSHNGEEYNELINVCIDTAQVYVEEEFNNTG